MDTSRRKRGRPRGSGKDDSGYLSQVAALVAREPRLAPTTAMRQVIYKCKKGNESDETLIRRLQAKWKAEGPVLLAAARKRLQQESAARSIDRMVTGVSAIYERSAMFLASPSAQRLFANVENAMKNFHRSMQTPEALRAMEAVAGFQRRLEAVARDPNTRKWLEAGEAMRRDPFTRKWIEVGQALKRTDPFAKLAVPAYPQFLLTRKS